MTWKPGESGNPSGKHGVIGKPVSEAISMELAMMRDGRRDDPVPARSLRMAIRAQLEKAAKGDLASLAWLADRMEGKAKQVLAGDSDAPISITAQVERGEAARLHIMNELARIAARTEIIDAVVNPESTRQESDDGG